MSAYSYQERLQRWVDEKIVSLQHPIGKKIRVDTRELKAILLLAKEPIISEGYGRYRVKHKNLGAGVKEVWLVDYDESEK